MNNQDEIQEDTTSMEEKLEALEEVCEDCHGTGIVVEGEHDDHTEKKCHCQTDCDEDDDA